MPGGARRGGSTRHTGLPAFDTPDVARLASVAAEVTRERGVGLGTPFELGRFSFVARCGRFAEIDRAARGWVAIDPKPMLDEPEYDVASCSGTRSPTGGVSTSPNDGLPRSRPPAPRAPLGRGGTRKALERAVSRRPGTRSGGCSSVDRDGPGCLDYPRWGD
jgi:hypothetical protein